VVALFTFITYRNNTYTSLYVPCGSGNKDLFIFIYRNCCTVYTVTADIYGIRLFGAIIALQTTGIINVRWWQHHQTKLPMARMSSTLHSLIFRYMI
jgi:hypothetical protein